MEIFMCYAAITIFISSPIITYEDISNIICNPAIKILFATRSQ